MDKEQKAIERIKLASTLSLQKYGEPLICTYSGGKDSDVLLELFKRSSVPFEVHNSHTTIDAPETVYHIREVFKDLEEQGYKATITKPTYKGGARLYVDSDTYKAYAAYQSRPLLLSGIKRTERGGPYDSDGRTLG